MNAIVRMDWKNPDVFYVYVLFHPVNGVPCYVGKGHGRRCDEQSRNPVNPLLRNIVAKAGLPLPYVKIRSGLSEPEAFELERVFIAAIGRRENGGPLANLTDGGDGVTGSRHSDETKRRISVANLGKKWGPEFGEKVRAGLTPEVRKRVADSLRGKPKSAEHREKIRLANIGKKRSPEACAAMSKAWHARAARLRS